MASNLWQKLRKQLGASTAQKTDEQADSEATGWRRAICTETDRSHRKLCVRRKSMHHFFETLEQQLISADLGVKLTHKLIETLKGQKFNSKNPQLALQKAVRDYLANMMKPFHKDFTISDARPFVILVSGVNGAGKTTTIGKLAYYLQNLNYTVGLIAGDSFRSGASAQLKIWAEKIGADFFATDDGGDPAALAYQTIATRASKRHARYSHYG